MNAFPSMFLFFFPRNSSNILVMHFSYQKFISIHINKKIKKKNKFRDDKIHKSTIKKGINKSDKKL